MWINSDVDLPQALITAQRDGRLVIFAGAGVSMGPPANLPSFETLADWIAGGTLTRKPADALDIFLGRVEQQGVDVQARARQFIDVKTSTPKRIHHALISLFREESVIRLVTTNFDRHFTTALRERHPQAEIFTAPALPLGRAWAGLAYLHGAVERESSRLVLTDRDFGQAYLSDAWATRFLMGMFEAYVVLFVGYSHADPVMKYLARSFIGGTSRFALTLPDQDDHWIHLGIVPVHFPKRADPDAFGALDDAIESWNASARMGVFDHRLRIGQLVAVPPPLEPDTIDYLRQVAGDAVTLRLFTEQAYLPEWLEWTISERLLEPLVRPEELLETGRLLARWFADRFVVEEARQALQFVQGHLATLNPSFADAIAFRLSTATDPLPEGILRLWSVALVAADTTRPFTLERLLERSVETGDISTGIVLLHALLRPRLKFQPVWHRRSGGEGGRLDVDLVLRGEAYALQRAWAEILKFASPLVCREVFVLVTEWINEASGLMRAAGRATDTYDPLSNRRVAIARTERDTQPDWRIVVDIARDVLEWAVVHDGALANAMIATWMDADPLLLRRLAIHGQARRTGVPASEQLQLIKDRGWLYAQDLKPETFDLLRTVFAQANEEAQQEFIDYSMNANASPGSGEGASDEYDRYNLAVWLAKVAPNSVCAHKLLSELQRQHPDFQPRPYPDRDRWSSFRWRGPRSPISVEDLLKESSSAAADYIAGYQTAEPSLEGPDRLGLMTIFGQAAAQNVAWALGVAVVLVEEGRWEADVWGALLQAWRTPTLSLEELRKVLALLKVHPQIGAAAPLEAAQIVEDALDRPEVSEEDVDTTEQIAYQILEVSDEIPPGVYTNGALDWLTSALNHPAGQVAMALIKAVSKRMKAAEGGWGAFSPDTRERFERLLRGEGHNATLARVIFASQVHFLFSADREWTESNVVPFFDWSVDEHRAGQAWHGFLTWGRWNDPLFACMLPFTLQTFPRVDALGQEAAAFVTALADVAAYSQSDPWVDAGWLFQFVREVDESRRAAWAQTFGRSLEALSAEGISEVWNRWLADYWRARATGVPRPLGMTEREAMVSWVCPLKAHLQSVEQHLTSSPPSTLDYLTLHRLKQCGLAESHGPEIARLLSSLLPHVTELRHEIGDLFDLANRALENGADREHVRRIASEMLRLGSLDGERLRAVVDDLPAAGGADLSSIVN
jgi:hypothetical protein